MRVRRRVHTPTTRCCTQREIGPVVVVDETSWCAMEVADGTKEGGTEVIPTEILDPPETGESRLQEPARQIFRGMLVLWQERTQGEPLLEEAHRFKENRIWIRSNRQGKSIAIALRRRIRKSQRGVSLRDHTQTELDEEDYPEIRGGVIR